MNGQPEIFSIFKKVSYDDLKTALENWLNPEGESVEETTGDLPWEKKEEKSTNSNPAKATQTDDISKAFDDLFSE